MIRIENVRFSDNRIYITLNDGTVKSRPLEAFPVLMDASDSNGMIMSFGRMGRASDGIA